MSDFIIIINPEKKGGKKSITNDSGVGSKGEILRE